MLDSWGQKRVGNIKRQLLLANEIILQFDRAQEHRTLTAAESLLRGQLKLRQEVRQRQQSKNK
jgi:hypothetical protein